MALSPRVVWLAALGVLPTVLLASSTMARLWTLGVVLLCLLDLALAVSPRTLRLTRTQPATVRWGEESRTMLRVDNTAGRRLRGVLRDAWQPSAGAADPRVRPGRRGDRHRLDIPAQGAVELTTVLRPARHGSLRTDRVTVRSFGPLGLAARQRSSTVDGLLRVLPGFPSRRHLPSRLARLRQLEGNVALQLRAQGTEFDSLRDYVRGDDVRSIDWRATARRRGLVVRTWRPERDRHIVVVLDTSRLSAGRIGDVPRLDSGMDAVLLLGALASRAGDRVSFLAGDRVIRSRVGGVRHRADLLSALDEAMTGLSPTLAEADWTLLGSALAQTASRASLTVLVTPVEPEAVRETLLPVLARWDHPGELVVASVADPEVARLLQDRHDADAVFTAAAAERTLGERRSALRALESTGADVLDEGPDELPVRLADHYLRLKALGRL